jgi:hypothetical protein
MVDTHHQTQQANHNRMMTRCHADPNQPSAPNPAAPNSPHNNAAPTTNDTDPTTDPQHGNADTITTTVNAATPHPKHHAQTAANPGNRNTTSTTPTVTRAIIDPRTCNGSVIHVTHAKQSDTTAASANQNPTDSKGGRVKNLNNGQEDHWGGSARSLPGKNIAESDFLAW